MGCDIHICTEAKKTVNGKEQWINVDHFIHNPYYPEEPREFELVEIYDGRSYILFSVLADVRNYDGIQPISRPKGIPADCSEVTKKQIDYWGEDGHSHSYLTLRELLNYQKEHSRVKVSGLVDSKTAKDLDEYGIEPSEWCGSTTDPGYEHREWTIKNGQLDVLISALKEKVSEAFYIYDFIKDKEIQILKRMDDIRIVFWFDN